MDARISLEPGSLLVVFITGMIGTYIAEVMGKTPLRLKVKEKGELANLKPGDFVIREKLSLRIQSKDECESAYVLREAQERGHPFISGLASLGVRDDELHAILPVE